MDDLVREALQEGRLTVAGGGPAALYTPWAAGFEKQYHRAGTGSVQHPARRRHRPAAGKRCPGCRRGDLADAAGLRAVEGGRCAAQDRHPGRGTRLVTVWMRGRSLAATAAPVAAASVPAGAGA